MKNIIKRIKNFVSVYFGIASLFRYINRYKAIILTYHLVIPESKESTRPICSISEPEFLRHMKWLSCRYNIVPISEIIHCVSKKKGFPKRCLAVSFDDGYRNFKQVAYPHLKRLKIPATLFISAGLISTDQLFWYDMIEYFVLNTKREEININVDGVAHHFDLRKRPESIGGIVNLLKAIPNKKKNAIIGDLKTCLIQGKEPHGSNSYLPMTWDEVTELCKDPMITVGSHTSNHVILSKSSDEELIDEVEGSMKVLEKHVPYAVEHFSYPNGQPGDFDERSKDMLKRAGYRSACTTIEDFNDFSVDLYELKRIGASLSLSELIPKISGFDNFLIGKFGCIGIKIRQ